MKTIHLVSHLQNNDYSQSKTSYKPKKKKGPHFFWLVSGLRVPDAHFKGSNLGDLISSFQGCDG